MAEKWVSRFEVAYPYLLAALITWAISYLPVSTPVDLKNKGWNLPAVYAALVTLNTFGAGLAVTIFVFTMAPAAGFIAKLEKLNIYKTFRRYLKEASLFGITSGTMFIPLSAATPELLASGKMPLITELAIYSGVCFFLQFYRASRIFLFWTTRN